MARTFQRGTEIIPSLIYYPSSFVVLFPILSLLISFSSSYLLISSSSHLSFCPCLSWFLFPSLLLCFPFFLFLTFFHPITITIKIITWWFTIYIIVGDWRAGVADGRQKTLEFFRRYSLLLLLLLLLFLLFYFSFFLSHFFFCTCHPFHPPLHSPLSSHTHTLFSPPLTHSSHPFIIHSHTLLTSIFTHSHTLLTTTHTLFSRPPPLLQVPTLLHSKPANTLQKKKKKSLKLVKYTGVTKRGLPY